MREVRRILDCADEERRKGVPLVRLKFPNVVPLFGSCPKAPMKLFSELKTCLSESVKCLFWPRSISLVSRRLYVRALAVGPVALARVCVSLVYRVLRSTEDLTEPVLADHS